MSLWHKTKYQIISVQNIEYIQYNSKYEVNSHMQLLCSES